MPIIPLRDLGSMHSLATCYKLPLALPFHANYSSISDPSMYFVFLFLFPSDLDLPFHYILLLVTLFFRYIDLDLALHYTFASDIVFIYIILTQIIEFMPII